MIHTARKTFSYMAISRYQVILQTFLYMTGHLNVMGITELLHLQVGGLAHDWWPICWKMSSLMILRGLSIWLFNFMMMVMITTFQLVEVCCCICSSLLFQQWVQEITHFMYISCASLFHSDGKIIHIEMCLFIPVEQLGHVSCMEELKSAYKSSVKEPEENTPFVRPVWA